MESFFFHVSATDPGFPVIAVIVLPDDVLQTDAHQIHSSFFCIGAGNDCDQLFCKIDYGA